MANDLKSENEQLKSLLKKANALLQEAHMHLDRDFNWKAAEIYDKKIKAFLKEHASVVNSEKKTELVEA
jgi:hypothetical protein